MRILLVEDEAEMAAALSSALKRYDMVVDHVPTLAEAEAAIAADVHGAVLLDRQLPDGDGLALIPKLRARSDGVPIIVLTARGDLTDRIAGRQRRRRLPGKAVRGRGIAGPASCRADTHHIPLEVAPLVTAINDALPRLDQGYQRHQRFVADAAHELRMPIAILNTRLESLPAGPDKTRLLDDTARLSTLAEQLLDIQRLVLGHHPFSRVNLAAVAQGGVADLAPLAISGGYELALETAAECVDSRRRTTAV